MPFTRDIKITDCVINPTFAAHHEKCMKSDTIKGIYVELNLDPQNKLFGYQFWWLFGTFNSNRNSITNISLK